jgi:hypothetical protein
MSLENKISCSLAALVCTLFRVSTVLFYCSYLAFWFHAMFSLSQFPSKYRVMLSDYISFSFTVESKDQFPDESSSGKTSATFLSAQVSVRPRRRSGRWRGAPHTGATPQQVSSPRYVTVVLST